MRTICSQEIFTKKCWQRQNLNSDPKEVWHYNHVTFIPIAKHFMLYCRLIYMLSMLYVGLTIKVKVGIPESFKVGWYPHKITGSSHLKGPENLRMFLFVMKLNKKGYLRRYSVRCVDQSFSNATFFKVTDTFEKRCLKY